MFVLMFFVLCYYVVKFIYNVLDVVLMKFDVVFMYDVGVSVFLEATILFNTLRKLSDLIF